MEKQHKFPYEWTLKNAKFTKDKGKVFSCFACGGGSTMGYKLAGFDVLGCNEIDPKMIEAYKTNHKPKFSYLESIQTFKNRKDLPKELYNLDILDGSPPCSSFSMAGNREKDWGKEKKFREGQSEQILDTLFFDFIDLAKELQPKIVVAENVKGLIQGDAKQYVRKIYDEFEKAGFYCQHFLLDASKMGVPQRRERVFFVCLRKDLSDRFLTSIDMFTVKPKIEFNFNEPKIEFKKIKESNVIRKDLTKSKLKHWENAKKNGRSYKTKNGTKFGYFYKCFSNLVCATITAGNSIYSIVNEPKELTDSEFCKIGSYPLDYKFGNNKAQYLIGMSVPPVMVAQISTQIYEQWIKNF
jgi:DNA (cytosine-5)-methyltransferase 1